MKQVIFYSVMVR